MNLNLVRKLIRYQSTSSKFHFLDKYSVPIERKYFHYLMLSKDQIKLMNKVSQIPGNEIINRKSEASET